MSGYIIQFFTVNLYITAFILFLLCLHLVRGRLISSRTIYNLWYILFILLSVPFVPFQVSDVFPHLFRNILSHGNSRLLSSLNHSTHPVGNLFSASQSVNDFTISVSRHYSPALEKIIPAVWLTGMPSLLILFIFTFKKIYGIIFHNKFNIFFTFWAYYIIGFDNKILWRLYRMAFTFNN